MKISRTLPFAVERFVELVVADIRLESAWLSCLSYMEELAATQIFKSITPDSPAEFLKEMETHAADEYRHAKEFALLRPLPAFTESKYVLLERKMRQVCGSFFIGYVGNPILVKASSRHVAYVHSALTIEQFPFQLYTAYLKYTKLPKVLQRLPAILADESGHLALGKKMREGVAEEEKLSLGDLNEIEKDMCMKLVERLYRVVAEFTGKEQSLPAGNLAKLVNANDAARIAWTYALGNAAGAGESSLEKKVIQHSVLFSRKKLLSNESYCAMEEAMSAALIDYETKQKHIEKKQLESISRGMVSHYQDFQREVDDMHIAHVLDSVVQEQDLSSEAPSDMDSKGASRANHAQLTQSVLIALADFDQSTKVSRSRTEQEITA